ncbi:unnamed protein product [Clonostachys rosea f. rosea IK726]|uniref:Uncharacterized protein n=1 Tax=Clonostachys rosea f. rosea IK726 TaxID=1349383 RepID=A0ACA9UMZ4_BIOOC|nr:unnamed protein product [Clonostachys rosea f. rosea IK726]
MAHLGEENPAHIELRPLASTTEVPGGARNPKHHGGRLNSETVSLINDEGHSQDYNEITTRPTGLLIRDTALPTLVTDLKDAHSKRQSNVFAAWGIELAVLLLSFGVLGAMIAILQSFRDGEVPRWNGTSSGGITLNALIGVLATIFRASLAFVAFEVLAELKWEWVAAQFRPLNDVQRFEDATRGAWGSMMLLPVVTIRQPLSIVAVIVVVLSVAIGPFAQQAMQTYYCLRIAEDRPATVQVAHRVGTGRLFYAQRPSYYVLHVGLQAAMQDAVVNPSNDSNIPSIFQCPTGNCTFPTYADHPEQPEEERASYASLAMCGRCEDVYDLALTNIKKQAGNDTGGIYIQLPVSNSTGYQSKMTDKLQVSPGGPVGSNVSYLDAAVVGDLEWASRVVPQDFLDVASGSAANFSILALSQDHCSTLANGSISCPLSDAKVMSLFNGAWGKPTDYVAAACTLYPCIKSYAGTVQDGALSETVVRSTPVHMTDRDEWWNRNGVQFPCWANGTLYTSSNMSSASEELPASAKQNVSIDLKYWPHDGHVVKFGEANVTAPRDCVMSVVDGFLGAVHNVLVKTTRVRCLPQGHQLETASCFAVEGDRLMTGEDSIAMAGFLHPRVTSLNTIRENVESLSLRITTQIRQYGWGPYTQDPVAVRGEAWESRTCLHVAWEWFALPATLLVLCTLLMAGMVVRDLRASGGSVVWKGSVLPFLLKDHVKGLETSSLKTLNVAARDFEIKLQKAD